MLLKGTRDHMFVYRKTPATLVRELTEFFRVADDVPPEHFCEGVWQVDPAGTVEVVKPACRSDHRASTPLLDRLAQLQSPSMATVRGGDEVGGTRGKGSTGSPAPWSARPAELLDEILRGAVDLNVTARRVLGFTDLPGERWSTGRRGRVALAGLPTLHDAIAERGDELREHWVVDEIDEKLRRWHRAALIITGHERPWASLGQHRLEAPPPYQGPVCPRDGEDQCRHQSCRAIRAARRPRWETSRCPYCRSASLRQDPSTGNVVCMRPSCRTDNGRRHTWTVDELARLGMIILDEANRGAA